MRLGSVIALEEEAPCGTFVVVHVLCDCDK